MHSGFFFLYFKSEKFELFEDLLQTSLKIQNQLIEDDRIN